jgi:hypothetical protein
MYSYVTQQSTTGTVKESKRAKGIQRAALATLEHYHYLEQLRQPAENYVNIVRIGQKNHRVYTLASKKRGLCAFDDKRFLLPDGIHTLAHGHYRARELQRQQQLEAVEEEETSSLTAHIDDHEEEVEEEEEEDDVIILSAIQTHASNIRMFTHREALDSLAGVNLREVLDRTVVRTSASVLSCPPPPKRARHEFESEDEDEDEEDGDICCTSLIDEAAQFVATNSDF